ncbi:MAG: hypothetical protein QOG15_918 [Solirubrobacteraceae bacterium]|jgi:ComF family protein|nr:hypothetical protein [Solirubrobacteraceae bacterium]
MLTQLVALVVPPCCAACRAPGLPAGEALCPACRRALPWMPADTCERCALPQPHARCPADGAAFSRAWAAMAYEGVARDAIRALKFARARPLADVMAAQIAACAPTGLLREGALVAVPAHPRRRRARGFDPAELLARALARRTGVAIVPALRRDAAAARQLGASRAQRREPGRLRFSARGSVPHRAILVDDVHTTGATLDACATALRRAGTQSIVAITWARTLDKGRH